MSILIYNISNNKQEAISNKLLLDLAFQMRNEIAHGAKSYDPYEYVKLGGEKILAQAVYWRMKSLVAHMIVLAIIKMMKVPGMKTLRFDYEDITKLIFI
ncbi:hypothetical protein ACTJJ0_05705 [Chitinophaga sp. 22321]|uniref:Apea-like HEPN domain-containing protein n=1 Tax=Chitinophaga hostae TaxID=2831022 RepID=A0ABS5J104_9BACT|nr:hypothetical protein [Chitinophaga hostae]MBS0028247.1 hypothetical protein [Chitinophaga hostae]